MKIIGHIRTDFPEKFGIPRQSGEVEALQGKIIFEPEYRCVDAIRGLNEFSHLWLLWEFSESKSNTWSPTVRPPRLGGNVRMGVFATRSPFRPNPVGLSCVKLIRIEQDDKLGPVLYVGGIDLLDNTPIYDIKPYLPYTDSHPEASGGFSDMTREHHLEVFFLEGVEEKVPINILEQLKEVLAQDPRPGYQRDPLKSYGMKYAGMNVRFCVDGKKLTVMSVEWL